MTAQKSSGSADATLTANSAPHELSGVAVASQCHAEVAHQNNSGSA